MKPLRLPWMSVLTCPRMPTFSTGRAAFPFPFSPPFASCVASSVGYGQHRRGPKGRVSEERARSPMERSPPRGWRRNRPPPPTLSSELDNARCHRHRLLRRSQKLLRSRAGRAMSSAQPAPDLVIRLRPVMSCRWERCSSKSQLCEAGYGRIWGDPTPRSSDPPSRTAINFPRAGPPQVQTSLGTFLTRAP